jgi:hypothetical protein
MSCELRSLDPEKIAVKCDTCGGTRLLNGPLERVNFVLSSMTSCPCGGVHETLPTAASHVYILKGDT